MTNEELAAAIKNGEHDRINELWEQIQGFGKWLSNNYSGTLVQNGVVFCRQEAYEDLYYSCCYPAMCKALDYFDPDNLTAGGFASLFRFCFMTEAAEFYGYRRKKNPLICAVSLNAPIPGSDGDGNTELGDMIPDPVDCYEQSERLVYLEQLHKVMGAALDSLDATQSDVIRKRYFERLTGEEIAERLGTTPSYIFSLEKQGFRRIRRGKYANQLREFSRSGFDYRAAGLSGNGLKAFNANGSSTERGAIHAIEKQERAQRRRRSPDTLCHTGTALQADRGRFPAGSA